MASPVNDTNPNVHSQATVRVPRGAPPRVALVVCDASATCALVPAGGRIQPSSVQVLVTSMFRKAKSWVFISRCRTRKKRDQRQLLDHGYPKLRQEHDGPTTKLHTPTRQDRWIAEQVLGRLATIVWLDRSWTSVILAVPHHQNVVLQCPSVCSRSALSGHRCRVPYGPTPEHPNLHWWGFISFVHLGEDLITRGSSEHATGCSPKT